MNGRERLMLSDLGSAILTDDCKFRYWNAANIGIDGESERPVGTQKGTFQLLISKELTCPC